MPQEIAPQCLVGAGADPKRAIALRANYPTATYALAKTELREGHAKAALPGEEPVPHLEPPAQPHR